MSQHSLPFVGTEAVATGRFTRRTLTSRNQMVYRNVYLPNGQVVTPTIRAVAAWLWSGRNAVVAGRSAAALHLVKWIDDDEPAELTRMVSSANDIVIHRERIHDDEVCLVRGIPTTTPERTAYDLGRRGPLETALVQVDAVANATGLTASRVSPLLSAHPGARGGAQLRQVLELMDGGAESPQETRTRLLLIEAGMRRPVTQIEVFDDYGHAFARIDMGWPELKVGVEYDGPQHWTDPERRSRDIDRYAELAARGWIIIRVNAELLRCRRWLIVDRVMSALETKDCPWLDECRVVSRPHPEMRDKSRHSGRG
jgi:hypothetical protein